MISVKFLLEAKSAAFTSATWSLGKAKLLKQCLVQRCYPETVDRMGPTGRFNYYDCFMESALPFSSAEEWAHKERKYQDTSQYVAWLNKMHSSSNLTEECLETVSIILSQRFIFKSVNCAVCKKNTILPIAAVFLRLDTHKLNFVYGQGLGIIYLVPLQPDTLMILRAWSSQDFQMLGYPDALGERCLSRTFWTFNETLPPHKIWWFQKS